MFESLFASVLAGLILSALSAATFLAYRHPEAYRNLDLHQAAMKPIVLAPIVLYTWNFALNKAFVQLTPVINKTEITAAQKLIQSITVPHIVIWGAVIITAFFWLYLVMLRYLHLFLDSSKNIDLKK